MQKEMTLECALFTMISGPAFNQFNNSIFEAMASVSNTPQTTRDLVEQYAYMLGGQLYVQIKFLRSKMTKEEFTAFCSNLDTIQAIGSAAFLEQHYTRKTK